VKRYEFVPFEPDFQEVSFFDKSLKECGVYAALPHLLEVYLDEIRPWSWCFFSV